MRLIMVTVLFMSLALTAGVVNADLRSDCLQNCDLNKRSCDDGCPPTGQLTNYDRTQCLKNCSNDYKYCRDSCPQPESTTSPVPYSSSNKSYPETTADKGMFNESSKQNICYESKYILFTSFPVKTVFTCHNSDDWLIAVTLPPLIKISGLDTFIAFIIQEVALQVKYGASMMLVVSPFFNYLDCGGMIVVG